MRLFLFPALHLRCLYTAVSETEFSFHTMDQREAASPASNTLPSRNSHSPGCPGQAVPPEAVRILRFATFSSKAKLANETFLPCWLCPLLMIQAKDYCVPGQTRTCHPTVLLPAPCFTTAACFSSTSCSCSPQPDSSLTLASPVSC